MVRIGVTGGAGRMGREVIAAVRDRPDCELGFAVNRAPTEDAVAGVELESAAEFGPLVAEREPNAIIDFTGPESALAYAETCANAGVAFVTGTTGFEEDELDALRAAAADAPILHAPNFSRGVQVLVNVVGEIVRQAPGYDVELIETHHREKRDAPSGTANRLLETIDANGDFAGRTHGREGDAPRRTGKIGVHAIRAGNVTGEHEIVFAGNDEEIRLTHRAGNRGVFAAGAVDAAVWIAGRDPGWYDFEAVIDA